jgi:hypothetical protein
MPFAKQVAKSSLQTKETLPALTFQLSQFKKKPATAGFFRDALLTNS